jgi:geranylgeranyl diphosphate synthase type II
MSTACYEQTFVDYKKRVENAVKASCARLGPPSIVRDACEYALLNGGKRFRPIIVLMVADALNCTKDVSPSALAIEYFHTASLVADDLPCMDDDDLRRNKPSVHKLYGESVALLVSYALIASGYGEVTTCMKQTGVPVDVGCMALEVATSNTGLDGATGGQFFDIQPPDLSFETLRDIIHKKTVSLFEISFVFGWLFGGGNPEKLPLVKKLASHFGMAFQFADDIDDVDQDARNGRKVNVAGVFGVQVARDLLNKEIRGYMETLDLLDLDFKPLKDLVDGLAINLSDAP